METDQTYSALTRCRGHQEQEWVDDGVDEAGADLPLLNGGQAHVGGAVGGVGDHGQLGEGPHDVLPDSNIPGVLGNWAPVTPQQLLGIQSAKQCIVVTRKWQAKIS